MSRCFPFPPPGYTPSSAKKEITIELIKLHKEKQLKTEKRREKKERRREKKERRRERKERRKNKRDEKSPNSDKSDTVKDHIGRQVCSEEFSEKREESKIVKSDLSSLTEEHGRPSCLPVPSSSSESTENTSNRNKRAFPAEDNQGDASLIFARDSRVQLKGNTGPRIRAEICNTESKDKGNTGPRIRAEICNIESKDKGNTGPRIRAEICNIESKDKGNTGPRIRAEICNTESKDKGNTGPRRRAEICNTEGINLRNSRDEVFPTSGQIKAVTRGKAVGSISDAVKPMRGVELQYKNLLENWLPPQLPDTSLYTVDSDWLFRNSRKNVERQDEKRRRCGSGNIPCVWARAEHLPEVGAFALPYVVPY